MTVEAHMSVDRVDSRRDAYVARHRNRIQPTSFTHSNSPYLPNPAPGLASYPPNMMANLFLPHIRVYIHSLDVTTFDGIRGA